ncbi:hypothetical protein V5G24_23030 [Xanthobacter sp. VTT E-85241]|uniref:hypothetical protein n=1 Tax=Roseixanthobacter finlandensis TaxID=3119922 RepID=UPI00372619F9
MSKYVLALWIALVTLISAPAFADGLADYSTTPGSNVFLFPEPMPAGDVNDAARQLMADVRSFYEDPQWIDLGFTTTQVNGNTFLVSGDKTAYFPTGRRIKADDILTYYGTVSSSTYSAPNTSVVVNMDSGSLTAALEKIYVGFVDGVTRPIPASAVSGSLVSVGLEAPSTFAVSRTPVTISDTISLTWVVQSSNTIFAGPASGNSATPFFRAISSSDLPFLVSNSGASLTLAVPTVSASTVYAGGAPLSMSYLGSLTANNSAALNFTSSTVTFDNTYRSYKFIVKDLAPQTDAVNFYVRVSIDGGTSWVSSSTPYGFRSEDFFGGRLYTNENQIRLTVSVQGNAAGEVINGEMTFFNMTSSTGFKGFSWMGMQTLTDGSPNPSVSGGAYKSTTPINGVQFFMSSGNVASGNIAVYGIK